MTKKVSFMLCEFYLNEAFFKKERMAFKYQMIEDPWGNLMKLMGIFIFGFFKNGPYTERAKIEVTGILSGNHIIWWE